MLITFAPFLGKDVSGKKNMKIIKIQPKYCKNVILWLNYYI